MLILDQSSSVILGPDNYDNWDVHMLGFATSIVQEFQISPDLTRVGVMKFSDDPDIAFHLYNYTDVDRVVEALQGLDIDGGDTNIAAALEAARTEMLIEERGARTDVRQLIFVVTDGVANIDPAQSQIEARLTKDAGIEIFTVGVRTLVDEQQLIMIASYPPETHYYYVSDFQFLNTVVLNLTQNACAPPPRRTATSTTTSTTTTPTTITATPTTTTTTSPSTTETTTTTSTTSTTTTSTPRTTAPTTTTITMPTSLQRTSTGNWKDHTIFCLLGFTQYI